MAPRPTDPDGVLVDELIALTRQSGMRMRRRIADTGLPMGPSMCLLALAKTGEIPTKRLADEMGVRGPTLTGLLDTLESAGLVRRRPDPADRRVTLLSATPKGQQLVTRLQRELAEEWRTILGPVPADRKRAWAATIRSLRELAQESPGTPPTPRARRSAE